MTKTEALLPFKKGGTSYRMIKAMLEWGPLTIAQLAIVTYTDPNLSHCMEKAKRNIGTLRKKGHPIFTTGDFCGARYSFHPDREYKPAKQGRKAVYG